MNSWPNILFELPVARVPHADRRNLNFYRHLKLQNRQRTENLSLLNLLFH